jgi:hypothetical protein
MIENVDWLAVLVRITEKAERKFGVLLIIEQEVVLEIETVVLKSLKSIDIERPNVAKVAGVVAFWIRKLKPIIHKDTSLAKHNAINEYISLLVGLSICYEYHDDFSKPVFKLRKRILRDWVQSFRYHSHSPHSSLIAFELLTTAH